MSIEDLSKKYDVPLDIVQKQYDKLLQETKQKWGEEGAEIKTLRKLEAKLQRKLLKGSQVLNVFVLAKSEPKDFVQIMYNSAVRKAEQMSKEEAIKAKIMDEEGNYYYTSGFQKGKKIDLKKKNFNQTYIALDVNNNKLIQLINTQEKLVLETKQQLVEAVKSQKNDNEFYITNISTDTPTNLLTQEELMKKLMSLDYVPAEKLWDTLNNNDNTLKLVESYVIDVRIGNKLNLVLQIPEHEETLSVWIDDAELAENIALDEPARVLINNASFNADKKQFIANSLLCFADPRALPEKTINNNDEVEEEESW